MKNLLPSKKQHELLAFIDSFIKQNEYAPSYREVMRALEYKSVSTVAKHVDGLIERGWLVKRDNAKRSLEVTYGKGKTESDQSPAPALPSGEPWLKELITARLAASQDAAADRATIVAALATLGLDDLRSEFVGAAEATEPAALEDRQ